MKVEEILEKRSENKCELCGSEELLSIYDITPAKKTDPDYSMLICETCKSQIEKRAEPDSKHWQCLTTSMWSEVPGIQIVSWRMLNRFKNESWAAENLDMMFMEDDKLELAKVTGDHDSEGNDLHRDANGTILQNGDTVILTKNLDVKGSSLSIKLGTIVRNIHLVQDNTEQIEGKVDGQLIVILTKFVRKQKP